MTEQRYEEKDLTLDDDGRYRNDKQKKSIITETRIAKVFNNII